MKNLIVGNGVNIQFGGLDYTNRSIINRAIDNVRNNTFSSVAYPYEILEWFYRLYSQHINILKGKYDLYAVFDDEKEELTSYKKHYDKRTKIHDIGFEDYFFIQALFIRKEKIKEISEYELHEFLKRFFLESIYNDGKINEIYKLFSDGFISFLLDFDSLLTTNYDQNIEFSTNREVSYLHGSFHFLEDVYNPNSFRNKLSDKPSDNHPYIKGLEYLFSNAISDSSSKHKQFSADMSFQANEAINKFTEAYRNNPELKAQIEEWKHSDNEIVKKLYESIQIKIEDSSQKYSENIKLEVLSKINGIVSIIGLSPNNDMHIFKKLDDNIDIDQILYYYYSKEEIKVLNKFFSKTEIEYKDVKVFWREINKTNT